MTNHQEEAAVTIAGHSDGNDATIYFVGGANDGQVEFLRLNRDGTIIFGPKLSPEEATQRAARLLAEAYSEEHQRLRDALALAEKQRTECERQYQEKVAELIAETNRAEKAEAEVARLREVLGWARVVLGNMADENPGAIFARWPIHHEPLRGDARHLLPVIDAALEPRND